MMQPEAGQDTQDLLGIKTIGGYQLLLLALGVLVLFADGFDAQMVGLVAPAMSGAWHVPTPAFAPVFAANVFGLMLGGMIFSVVADSYGRRLVITVCVAVFGITSLLTAMTTNIAQLAMIRFVSGLALGGAMPCMIAGTSDYFAVRIRTRIAVLLTSAWSLGIAICAYTTSRLVGPYGWQSLYLIGSVLPIILTPVLFFVLPESPLYLIRRGQFDRLGRLLARISPTLAFDPATPIARAPFFPVAALFTGQFRWATPCLWAGYFCAGATVYFFLNWLPIFVKEAGFMPGQAALVATFYQIGGLFGGLAISALIDRGGVTRLAGSSLCAAVAVAMVGLTSATLPLLMLSAALAGAFVVGSQNSANAFTGSRLYPSDIRATGLGWALGWVRLSGVLAGALGGGWLIGLHLGPARTLLVIAAPEIGAGLAYFGIALAMRSAIHQDVVAR